MLRGRDVCRRPAQIEMTNDIVRRCLSTFLVASVSLAGACGSTPPLRVTHDGDKVIVNLRTLGEYQTSVSRVRLVDTSTDSVVWELSVKNGEPQIFEIVLTSGSNSAMLPGVESGTYEVLVPKNSSTFVLERSRPYAVEVWGKAGSSARASFTP